jgi:hypothetical protein
MYCAAAAFFPLPGILCSNQPTQVSVGAGYLVGKSLGRGQGCTAVCLQLRYPRQSVVVLCRACCSNVHQLQEGFLLPCCRIRRCTLRLTAALPPTHPVICSFLLCSVLPGCPAALCCLGALPHHFNKITTFKLGSTDKEEVAKACGEIKSYPPLIFAGECRNLQERLAKAAVGEAFILQGGDCAEAFTQFSANQIRWAARPKQLG